MFMAYKYSKMSLPFGSFRLCIWQVIVDVDIPLFLHAADKFVPEATISACSLTGYLFKQRSKKEKTINACKYYLNTIKRKNVSKFFIMFFFFSLSFCFHERKSFWRMLKPNTLLSALLIGSLDYVRGESEIGCSKKRQVHCEIVCKLKEGTRIGSKGGT